jgi:cytochrome d ubiquinol oxidase subunit I
LAVGARWWLRGNHVHHAETMLRMALGMLIILTPLQAVIGDMHGLVTLQYQPAKIAAIEAHWDGSKPAPLVLFAVPDEAAETNRWEVGIPNLGALILTREYNGLFKGLKDFPREDRPPVTTVFWSFRVMVGLGIVMILLAAAGALQWVRGRLFRPGRLMRVFALTWPIGFIAVLAGWFTTEVGRQPWLATGVLRTADAVSPVGAAQVATSLALFVLVYGVIFTAGIVYINRLLEKGPIPLVDREMGLGNRPIAAAQETGRAALSVGE